METFLLNEGHIMEKSINMK
jgi:hypothetical protein